MPDSVCRGIASNVALVLRVMNPIARLKSGFALAMTLPIALFFVAYPNYVIRPERPQGAKELQAALFVLRYQQVVELVCAAVALVALVLYWRSQPARKSRIGATIATALVFVCAAFSRLNIYEYLFHPAGAPAFQAAQ
jgi:hypothetical protein